MKHTQPRNIFVWTLTTSLLATISFVQPAIANIEVPVNKQQLVFNQGKFSENITSLITQRQGVNDDSEDLGDNAKLGSYIFYYDVISGVDAILTITGIEGMDTDNANRQIIEEIDESNSGSEDNRWINTDLDTDINGNGWVEYTLEFFQDLDAFTRIPVTLTDVVMNTYDIDGDAGSGARQYLEVSDFSRYYLTSDSELTASEVSGLRTRFTSQAQSSSLSDAENRVKVEFDRVSSVVFRLGQLTTQSGREGAEFFLDFSAGTSWTPADPVVSPVLASQTPRAVNYEGPLNVRISPSVCSDSNGEITGARLETITEVYVENRKVPHQLLSDGSLSYSLSGVLPGAYTLKLWVSVNNLFLTGKVSVSSCLSSPAATTPGTFTATKLFANYRGDRGPVVARDLADITAFIKQYPGITTVTCTGSTSGVPAKRTDPALAQSRAKNACDAIQKLVPTAKITLATSTGKGIGQRFRSVTVTISGTR